MSIFIKQKKVQMKNSDGVYEPIVDTIAEKSSQEIVNDIKTVGNNIINSIKKETDKVPDNFGTVVDEVNSLSTRISANEQSISTINSNLSTKRLVIDKIQLSFNNQYQLAIGTIRDLSKGKITDISQVKGISVVTNGYFNVFISSNKTLYVYITSLQNITSDAYWIGLVIDYI